MQSIHDKYYREMIAELVSARNALGLTQEYVANKWGRKQSIIAKIETCERRIDIIEFIILANIVKLDVDALIKRINISVKNEN